MKKLFVALSLISLSLIGCGNRSKATADDQNASEKTKATTIELTKADFLKKVVNYEEDADSWNYLGDKPAIIDFYATWCGPCKKVAPILEELANEYADEIVVYKIDVDKEVELKTLFGITAMPTFLFIPMDEEPQITVGGMGKADFKNAIDQVLLKKDIE